MLNNTKLEIHTEVATEALEKRAVAHLGSIQQDAANAPEMDQNNSMQRRLRRQSRNRRNTPSSLGLWCSVNPKTQVQRGHKPLAARQRLEGIVALSQEALTQQVVACVHALRVLTRTLITALHSLGIEPLFLHECALC